ncbi:hypothetical protein [Zhaonella formicivorans]|uniref:hypothetical protein n=1 Tax=Zhaonella formicivorans TaxID=2528593 RepID=UPI0010EB3975|nr:hypothetical protein [Zhaonella formicivorans]
MANTYLSLGKRLFVVIQALVIIVLVIGTWYYTLPSANKEKIGNIGFVKEVKELVQGVERR